MVKWQRRRGRVPDAQTAPDEVGPEEIAEGDDAPSEDHAEPVDTADDGSAATPLARPLTSDDDEVDDPGEDLAADPVDEPVDEPLDEPDLTDEERRRVSRLRLSVQDSTPVTLALAAHPRQAVGTALAVAAGAAAMSRPGREIAVVLVTVLIGQTILGWHNDLVDRARDARHLTPRKPIAEGRLDAGTAWFALVIALLLLVPLSITTGITAGCFYLGSVAVGLLGNLVLRRGLFSWVSWAASFALIPFYLAHGGWGGGADGDPPVVVMVVLAALLGVGVHVMRAIWGLVADDADGWTYVPLRLGRRLGATRLLVLTGTYLLVVVAVIAIVGSTVGLRA